MEQDHCHSQAVCKEQNMFPAKAAATFLISPLRSPDAKARKVPATVQSIQPAPHPHCRNWDKTGVLTFHSVKLTFSNTEHPLLQCLLSLTAEAPRGILRFLVTHPVMHCHPAFPPQQPASCVLPASMQCQAFISTLSPPALVP